jgi:hypothetical protein
MGTCVKTCSVQPLTNLGEFDEPGVVAFRHFALTQGFANLLLRQVNFCMFGVGQFPHPTIELPKLDRS